MKKNIRKSHYETNAELSIREVNKKRIWVNRYWNEDRLIGLVRQGMRYRFQKAQMLYRQSLTSSNYKKISEMASMMVRGYDALVEEAKKLGHAKLSPNVWIYKDKGTKYIVVKTDMEYWLAHNTYSEEPNTIVIALSELFRMADHHLLDVKKHIKEHLKTTAMISEYKIEEKENI